MPTALDNSITASGKLDFTAADSPDFGRSFMIGHFSTTGPAKIGIGFTHNSTGQGLFWQPRIVLANGTAVLPLGQIAFDTNIDREWSYAWDPLEGVAGSGEFTVSLSGPSGGTFGFDLSGDQRLVGGTFDAFGFSGNPAASLDSRQSASSSTT